MNAGNPEYPENRQPTVGRCRLYILGATVLWSTSGLFTKAPWLDVWPVEERGLQLAFWRALFAGGLLLPFARKMTFPPLLFVAAAFFAAMNISFLKAMTLTTAANAIWLQYAAPAWVFLVGVGVLGEKSARQDVWMLCCAIAGVSTILFFESTSAAGTDQHWMGSLWGIASGVTFAGVVLCIRGLRSHDSAWIVAVCQLAAAGSLAPYVLSQRHWPDPAAWTTVALFGTLQLGLPYLLFAWGTRGVTSHEASFITLLEPLLVPLWVFIAWGRSPEYTPPAPWTIAGGALILIGLLLRYSMEYRSRYQVRMENESR